MENKNQNDVNATGSAGVTETQKNFNVRFADNVLTIEQKFAGRFDSVILSKEDARELAREILAEEAN